MTTGDGPRRRLRPRPPNPVGPLPAPQGREPPSGPRDRRGDLRVVRGLALAALALSVVALALAAWRAFSPASGASCQSTAWNAEPAAADLPDGWTIGATQFDVDRATTTVLGPGAPGDSTNRAVVYATVTCYRTDASAAVDRSAAAAQAAGQTVSTRTDLGDQGYTSLDDSGAVFVQFRHGDVVTYLASSGGLSEGEVDQVAGAFDRAQGGDGASTAGGSADAGDSAGGSGASDGASGDEAPGGSTDSSASPSPAAPELEAVLPRSVDGTPLTVDSVVGTDLLGDDQASRTLSAALRAEGRSATDLRMARAFDETGTLDVSVTAVTVRGMDRAALRTFVLTSWLTASGPGVKTSPTTLGTREFTKVDYGDAKTVFYVTQDAAGHVIFIETADPALATKTAAALP